MSQAESYDSDVLSFAGFTRALKRNRNAVILTFLASFALLVFYTVIRGRDFESTSKLFIRKGRETVTIDPTANASGQLISVTETQDREINSIVSILFNRDLLEEVVDNLGTEQILAYSDPDSPIKKSVVKKAISSTISLVKDGMRNVGLLEVITEREEAIIAVRDSLNIESSELSAVIKVSVTTDSPKLSQILNQEIIKVYTKYHTKANSTVGSLSFFDEQSNHLKAQLEEASSELATLKIENNVLSMGIKKEVMEKQLMAVEDDLVNTRAGLAAATSKIKELDSLLESETGLIPSGQVAGMANTAKDAMREQLYNLQIEQSELLSKYSESHPLVESVAQKIKQAKSVFDEEEKQVQSLSSINEVHQSLRISLLNAKAQEKSLESKLAALQKEKSDLQKQFQKFASNEYKLIAKERQVQLLDTNYRRYVENLEKVRINRELDNKNISNVNVVQEPSLVEYPVGLSNTQMYGLGLILSVCLACAIGIVLDIRSPQTLAASESGRPVGEELTRQPLESVAEGGV